MNPFTIERIDELGKEIAKATPHDNGVAKLLSVIEHCRPNQPPKLSSWAEFEEFWKRWYPDGLLEANKGRVQISDPTEATITIKMVFLEEVHWFLTKLREERLQTLNLLSEYPWALEPPPKRGLFRSLFG